MQWFWGICIASNSEIGPGLYIAHHGQIFVGVQRMGANCTIGHSVTIGRTEKEHGYPVIGDNVYVAPGGMIIGKIEVGDNVKVGPYAVVRKNVPSNSVIIAPPPRVVRMTSKEDWLSRKDTEEDPPPPKEKPSRNADYRNKHPYRRPQSKQKYRTSDQRKPSGDNRGNSGKTDGHSKPRTVAAGKDNKPRDRKQYNRPPKWKRNESSNKRYPSNKNAVPNNPAPAIPAEAADEQLMKEDNSPSRRSSWSTVSKRDIWSDDMEGEALDG